MKKLRKIISGGQTGADRAAFDFALEKGIEIGGFVPKGRRAEDGKIPEKYSNLIETTTRNYSERTALNIQNSDATLILSHGKLKGGLLLTKKIAENHHKPLLLINFTESDFKQNINAARKWLTSINCRNLNIA